MRIISFAWTTPALLAGVKTVTRRDWDEGWAARFAAGDLVAAWDRSPRAHGRQVATIRLTADPRLEPLREMPDGDYEAEGLAWMAAHPEAIPRTIFGRPTAGMDLRAEFERWCREPRSMWVVRFELVSVL